jgi:arsenate reductase (thioredoxin)
VRILFVCTANACRSQMAEGWARHLAPAGWEVGSAGLVPYPVSRRARAVMAEVGIDLSGHREKSVTEAALRTWDVVVTLSEEAGRYLPRLGPSQRHLRRPVVDPMSATGTTDEVREAFRTARDRIGEIVREVLAEVADRPAGK